MFVARNLFVVYAGALLITGCAQSPTAPTTVPGAAMVGIISQEPPPIPPRSHTTPLNAVGATRFVTFGDSITFGVISSADGTMLYEAPNRSYPERLRIGMDFYHANQAPFSVRNRGIPGETTQQATSRIASVLASDRPQALLLLEGINDLGVGRSVGSVIASLETLLGFAQVYNTPVVIATMFQTYRAETPDGRIRENAAELVPALNAGIRRLATGRQNVYLVDLERVFGSNRSLVGGDGLHPTEAGYEVMATAFMTVVETAFPVRSSFQ